MRLEAASHNDDILESTKLKFTNDHACYFSKVSFACFFSRKDSKYRLLLKRLIFQTRTMFYCDLYTSDHTLNRILSVYDIIITILFIFFDWQSFHSTLWNDLCCDRFTVCCDRFTVCCKHFTVCFDRFTKTQFAV